MDASVVDRRGGPPGVRQPHGSIRWMSEQCHALAVDLLLILLLILPLIVPVRPPARSRNSMKNPKKTTHSQYAVSRLAPVDGS
jgi:hypothetical protein